MECKDIIQVLSKFQDSELEKDLSESVRIHLKKCKDCRKELHLLEEALLLIKGHNELKVPDNFTAVLMNRIENENRKGIFVLPSVIYSFVFAIFFFLGIFVNFEPGNSGEKNKTIDSVSELLMKSQKLSLLNIQNNSFSHLLGVKDEKRVD